jgi:hypothetical protein
MSQYVTISDELLRDARLAAEISGRSIDEQIERWAQLGRAIEPLLERSQATDLADDRGRVKPTFTRPSPSGSDA